MFFIKNLSPKCLSVVKNPPLCYIYLVVLRRRVKKLKVFVPDYYLDFECIAEKCRHSCCKGWEIEIDDETAQYYKNIPGEFGEKLRRNIDFGEGCSNFILCENECCPFLNEKGLCDIIINLGEDSLCQICADHPRFRNYFEGRVEIGLGLCCEAAAVLILDKKTKVVLEAMIDDEDEKEIPDYEKAFFSLRDAVFAALQNRSMPIEKRMEAMLKICGGKLPEKSVSEWVKIFLGLERLEESWTKVLEHVAEEESFCVSTDEVTAEQLLYYFIFRHLSGGLFDGRIAERAVLAVLSFYMIQIAAKQVGIYEAARLYSSEIEYSSENIEALLEIIALENEVFL